MIPHTIWDMVNSECANYTESLHMDLKLYKLFMILVRVAKSTFVILVIFLCKAVAENYDPCCSFPCQHRGVCNTIGGNTRYYCDCEKTGYYGVNCQTPFFSTRINNFVKSLQLAKRIVKSSFLSMIVNNVGFVQDAVQKLILKTYARDPPFPEPFNHFSDYTTWEGYNNKTYYTRTLPPVPKNCPTPMGVAGPKTLPEAATVIKEVFLREKFRPTTDETNILVPTYGQFYTHNVFQTEAFNPAMTWGTHFLDLDTVYGITKNDSNALRTFKNGEMKTQVINGETFPPNLKDVPSLEAKVSNPKVDRTKLRFALANPFYSMFPTLTMWATLFIREHNRVCGVLKKEHPEWDDERLYQTSRLIVIAVNLKMIVEDYMQKVSNSKVQGQYRPELMHDEQMPWGAASISTEFSTLYHFHQGIPDQLMIEGKPYEFWQLINNHDVLTELGTKRFVEALSKNLCGSVTGGKNLHKFFIPVWAKRLENLRKLRTQPFNEYRKYYGLEPYKTFEDLAGNPKSAEAMKKLYNNDIDAVEFFVGAMVEKPLPYKLYGSMHLAALTRFAYRNIFSNIVGSPTYWKPSTFGGPVGFEIVKTTRMKDFMCRNINGCPNISLKLMKDDEAHGGKNEL